MFWLEMPSEAELEAYYRSRYTGDHEQTELQEEHRNYYRRHAEELRQRRPGRIADVGCSIPVFAREAHELGIDVIGVDWSDQAMEAGAKWGVNVVKPGKLAGPVAILRFSHVLEHMLDPVAVLTGYVADLEPGGLVYVTQPNLPVLALEHSPVPPPDAVWPEHLHFFSPISLRILLERAGLTVNTLFASLDGEGFSGCIDYDHTVRMMRDIPGDNAFPLGSNLPYYHGPNSTAFATKPL